MYRDYKVVAFIPAGRKKTMSMLLKYLEMNKGVIDKVQVWYNPSPTDKSNQAWLKTLESDFVDVKYLPEKYEHIPKPIQFNNNNIPVIFMLVHDTL